MARPDLIAADAVARLQADYAQCLDSDALERWPGFFLPEAHYRITTARNEAQGLPIGYVEAEGRAMMEDRVLSLREANIYEAHRYRHILSIPRILTTEDGETTVETGFLVVRVMQSGDTNLFAVGQYNDRIVERDGGLKFAAKTVVLDSEKIDTLLAIPL